VIRLAALVCLLLAVAGCGSSAPSTDPPQPRVDTDEPTDVTTRIVGASAAQTKLLHEILAGVDSKQIEQIVVRPPEPGWKPFPDGAVEVALSGPDDMEGDWERWLVAGAFSDRSHDLGLPVVEVVSVNEDGSRLGARSMVRGPDREEPYDEPIRDVRKAAADAGAAVRRIRVVRPWDAALAVSLEVEDPAAFLVRRYERYVGATSAIEQRFPDGSSLEIYDRDGELILLTQRAERVSAWSTYVKRELEGCAPILMSRPLGDEPPPCPVG
jgi:hypothetical protein